MEKQNTVYVHLEPGTSDLDDVRAKVEELNCALEKANSLTKELASETVTVSVAIGKID